MDRQSQQQPWKVRIFDILIRLWKFARAYFRGEFRISGGGEFPPPGYMPRINSESNCLNYLLTDKRDPQVLEKNTTPNMLSYSI